MAAEWRRRNPQRVRQLYLKHTSRRKSLEELKAEAKARTEKICRVCKATKPLGEFLAVQRNRDGHGSECRSCCTKRTTARDRAKRKARAAEREAARLADLVPGQKRCTRCHIRKPLQDFGNDSRRKDGKMGHCKDCGREAANATSRKWRKAHPLQWQAIRLPHRASARFKRSANPKADPRERLPGIHTAKEWQDLCSKFDNRCVCCGCTGKLTQDHVVPMSWPGSSNFIDNLQPLCLSCNTSKGNRRMVDYRQTPFTGKGVEVEKRHWPVKRTSL